MNAHPDVLTAGQWLRRNIKAQGFYTHQQLVADSGCQLWALIEAWRVMREYGDIPIGAMVDWGYEGQFTGARRAAGRRRGQMTE